MCTGALNFSRRHPAGYMWERKCQMQLDWTLNTLPTPYYRVSVSDWAHVRIGQVTVWWTDSKPVDVMCHVGKGNCGQYPNLILLTLSRVHAWKWLMVGLYFLADEHTDSCRHLREIVVLILFLVCLEDVCQLIVMLYTSCKPICHALLMFEGHCTECCLHQLHHKKLNDVTEEYQTMDTSVSLMLHTLFGFIAWTN